MTTSKKSILLFLCFLMSAIIIQAEMKAEIFNETLPSEETLMELEVMGDGGSHKPNLRQAPDDDSWAQKEVPITSPDSSVLLLLLLGSGVYLLWKGALQKKTRQILDNKNKLVIALIATFTMFAGQELSAQLTFKANPDNAFVVPNSSTYTTIDVLVNDYYNFGNPGDCTKGELEVTLWNGSSFVAAAVNSTLGRARITADNQIEYRPSTDVVGTDKITYQIHCSTSGQTSQADIYIHVNDKPDPISDADCYVDPVGIKFEMNELARTNSATAWVHTQGSPLCGDIDGDGNVEIITYKPRTGSLRQWEGVQIWKVVKNPTTGAISINLQQEIQIENSDLHNCFGNFAIAKVDGNKYASLFVVATSNQTLAKYDFNDGNKKYEQSWVKSYAYPTPGRFTKVASPLVVDIMGTGRTQVCILSKVFDTKTGNLLVEGTNNLNQPMIPGTADPDQKPLFSFGHFGCSDVTLYQSVLIPADVNGDGKLEIIGGDCVYAVNIDDFDKQVAGNTFKLLTRANKTNHAEIGDGGTAVADFDGDGLVDVIVTGPTNNGYRTSATAMAYIYNPRTGAVLHNNIINDIPRTVVHGPSQPFVGDLDGDGLPEFSLTGFKILVAYKLNPVSKTLSLMWDLPTTDASASTTLSMFDFAQDGKAKLIYRDQETLRIIDGRKYDEHGVLITTAKRALATFNGVLSGTINEYPIVADVDGDGHAEIITIGSDIAPSLEGDKMGTIRIFGAIGTQKWAPARNIWNQTAYNPLYVNDDLTVPSNPISPATVFYSPDGTKNRPFNNFLQQSTSLNKEGTMIMLGPDLVFDPRVPKRLKFGSSNDLEISVGVLNQGDAIFTGAISLQLYAYIQSSNSYVKVGSAYSYSNTGGLSHVSPNNAATISYTIANISSALPSNYDNLFMTVNLSSKPGEVPVFLGSTECHGGYNNFASGFSLVSGERVICEGETETVNLEGGGTYTIKWYTQATGGSSIHTGSSMNVPKNSDPVTHYFVESYATSTSSTPITNIRDTVFVYLAPDSLVWTGKGGTSDWHDWQNWKDPSETLAVQACVPRACTNVQLPSDMSIYPNLDNTATIYTKYAASECNNIHFSHGGELARPDMLIYDKAFVDVTFRSHRWYLFAPPLKDFYTGDFYIDDPIPANDIIKAYTKFWARRNPWTNFYQADWTGTLPHPDVSFSAGQGLGLWIGDKAVSGQVVPPRDPFDFSFPKYETEYNIYVEDTTIPTDDPNNPYQTPRVKNHRFIFDGATAGTNFNLTIDSETKIPTQLVLVGNPFMAHLDFDKFYAANSAFIQNYYIVLDENVVQQHYNKDVSSTLSKNIAPMQSFFVEVKAPFTNLVANGTMTLSVPGDKLRSTSEENEQDFSLRITASHGEYSHQTFVKFTDSANDGYQAGEDIAVLFPDKVDYGSRSIILYSRTGDDMKTSLNVLNFKNLVGRKIPLGIWSPKAKPSEGVTINVSNLNLLPKGYNAYLEDKLTGLSHDLSLNSMKYFESITPDNSLFVDNRFYLAFAYAGANIEENQSEVELSVSVNKGVLDVRSQDVLRSVQLYNLQGGLVLDRAINSDHFQTTLKRQDVYILKVTTVGGKTVVRKLLASN